MFKTFWYFPHIISVIELSLAIFFDDSLFFLQEWTSDALCTAVTLNYFLSLCYWWVKIEAEYLMRRFLDSTRSWTGSWGSCPDVLIINSLPLTLQLKGIQSRTAADWGIGVNLYADSRWAALYDVNKVHTAAQVEINITVLITIFTRGGKSYCLFCKSQISLESLHLSPKSRLTSLKAEFWVLNNLVTKW